MNHSILFSILISATSALVIKNDNDEIDRFFLFPGDGDNILHLVDTDEPIDEDTVVVAQQPRNHGFWLYTRSNPTEADILVYEDHETLLSSHFNFNKTTVFLIHGWLGSGDNEMNQMLTEAFLEDRDVNIIIFDWSELANRNYLTAKYSVPNLGQGLALFIKWLASLGATYDKMHLVGFSLGGHIVGNAGRHTGSLIKRITALDPAGPLWKRDKNRLTDTDAQYVEVIHTSTLYGYKEPCGHADFYPNGGLHMPGCWSNSCSHSKGYEYMAASVRNNNFYANECNNLKEAVRGVCQGRLYPMGNSDLNKFGSGIFRVDII